MNVFIYYIFFLKHLKQFHRNPELFEAESFHNLIKRTKRKLVIMHEPFFKYFPGCNRIEKEKIRLSGSQSNSGRNLQKKSVPPPQTNVN